MYTLSENKLRSKLLNSGYRNISDFSSRKKLNRNTLYNYLNGKSIFSHQFLKISKALACDPFEIVDKMEMLSGIGKFPELSPIVNYLKAFNNKLCIFLFGSHTADSHHQYADWDFGIATVKGNLTSKDYITLQVKLEEMTDHLAMQIDLVNIDAAPDWFIGRIRTKPVFLGGHVLAWYRFLRRWEACREK